MSGVDITQELLQHTRDADKIIALTGAGLSVESGIAPFRGKGGLWETFDPEEYAHIRAFQADPSKSWELFRLQYSEISRAKPNAGHGALVELEAHGLEGVITQNIDGLHGNSEVVELHGNISRSYCTVCDLQLETEELMDEKKSIYCGCGGVVRPDVVLFGEPLSKDVLSRAFEMSSTCDLMLVIGTSAVVHPAASLPMIARDAGATVVEINLAKTPLTGTVAQMSLFGSAGDILSSILEGM